MERKRWFVAPDKKVLLEDEPTRSTEGAPGDKSETIEGSDALRKELTALQNRLYAEGRRSLLLVLQAMDAGGKDGAIRKVFSGVNPQSCRVTSFKQPSTEELQHDFLWRIHKALPEHGEVGIFNRSHYEDVGVARVKNLVPKKVIRQRYGIIKSFEHALAVEGTTVVKVFLHISKDEQKRRLQARLDDPTKRWKYRAGDLDDRKLWDDYMAAYGDRDHRNLDSGCAVVRDPRGPEVVPRLGFTFDPRRDPDRDGPALSRTAARPGKRDDRLEALDRSQDGIGGGLIGAAGRLDRHRCRASRIRTPEEPEAPRRRRVGRRCRR